MKKMKLAAMFAALVSVFTFSSCLDSDDNGVDYDAVDYFTLKEYLGAYYLAGDISGCSFVPVSQSVLASIKYTNSDKYANRFYGAVKFAEGESVTEGKTSYKISEIIPQLVLSDKEFNTRPDTLKSFAVSSLECSGWSNVVW